MNAMTAEEDRSVFGFASGFREPEVMRKTHQHQELELNFLLRGSLTYLIAGEVVQLQAMRLAVFWAAAPHRTIAVEPRSRFYWFTVPIAWVLQWDLPAWFVRELLHGRLFAAVSDPDDEKRCASWHRDLDGGRVEGLRIAQLEMEARLRRLILGLWPMEPSHSKRGGTRVRGGEYHVQRMAAVIAERYTEKLSVAEIAAPTGLHPNYAMALFKKTCGLSLVDYIVQMRLFHARRLLTTSDAKIIEIAHSSGFGSESRFYEAFTASCRCTPSEYRRKFRNS